MKQPFFDSCATVVLRALAALAPSVLASGCAVASGEVHGGDPLLQAATPAVSDDAGATGPATWSALYADYFGPTGKANCTSLSNCHSTPMMTGSTSSGFVCGMDKDTCWKGMTMGVGCASAVKPCPIASGTDPTKTGLYPNLRPLGTMPLNGNTPTAPGYNFTQGDLARIAQWIREGAKNN